ncbi:MAG: 2-hydroxyacid dehydrogenase [Dehalococcoidia bacterium]|nr:2-hydroxyacid dehydrogenase [Dehalococcoidia bacterium]
MSPKVVMYGPDESLLTQLQEAAQDGSEIEWVDSNLSDEESSAAMKDTRAVILGGTVDFGLELAAKCSELRLIQTTSAGTDRLDKAALGELGIKVSNNGGGNAVAVAEHTITLMVGVYRKLHLQFQNVQDGNWMGDIRPNWFSQAHELTGKTVGIIGLGRIGSRVARRLQGWECDLIYDDIVAPDPELVSQLSLKKVERDELLETSDLITLHVPLNRQTRGMISDREFDLMKPTAVLINACRGPVVDEAALIRAMNENKIMAAGVDVLELEPTPENNPLIDMDNVLITPHLAAFTQEAGEKSRAFAMYNCSLVSRGEDPESVVLPDD